MLLIFILILILIGATIVTSIYSNFLVFYSNFSESENYHKAYYNSIAAVERAELVTKQRSPGYEGNGGWKIDTIGGTGSINNGGSDGIISNFSYLSNSGSVKNTSSVFWSIKSKTSRIPAKGEGDVELMLAANDSNNYNMMDYEDAQIFLLYYDDSTGNPYTKVSCENGTCQQSKPKSISGEIRLPKYLITSGGFTELNTSTSLVGTGPGNDAIVDWQVRGKYKGEPFTIYSKQEVNGKIIRDYLESAIRETDINNTLNFDFSTKLNPIRSNSGIIVISTQENKIKQMDYEGIFSGSNNPQLRFSLLNLLKDKNNKLYPFLEYYADFGTEVADKYFTINAEGNFVDYHVNTIIRKPTTKESVLGNFSSIF